MIRAVVMIAAAIAGVAPERVPILDNDSVAVTRLRFAPAAREDVHSYPFPVVLVQLTAGAITVKDREMLRRGGRPGEVWFLASDTPHAVANTSQATIDILAIAIKPGRAPAPAAPATTAPEGITRATLVDNDDVRVVRVRFAPGSREPLHSHPNDLVTVQITRGTVDIVSGASRSSADREPGFVQFVPRTVTHAYASADTKPFELLSVAIK